MKNILTYRNAYLPQTICLCFAADYKIIFASFR